MHRKQINIYSVQIDGQEVENVTYFILWVSCLMNVKIEKSCSDGMYKLSKIVGTLNRLKRKYPQQALLSIYNSLFMSLFYYEVRSWITCLRYR